MKTKWDYSDLAKAYLKRPNYSDEAITRIFELTSIGPGAHVCDVGAGVAHLTIELAKRGLNVVAVEPNDSMRQYGKMRTEEMKNVSWFEGTGERTGQNDSTFDLVTFGSSFNVTDRQQSLKESKRILMRLGWFAAMWNHRDLTDPIQQEIEEIIKKRIPEYGYGVRREDQADVLNASSLSDLAFIRPHTP
ncbi:MAG: methyltransferase domain-containing protein [Gammaproteobacteria bacterium]|nr:methyltransferase domain-containing protein [Gammaproteobacteria bacterium]